MSQPPEQKPTPLKYQPKSNVQRRAQEGRAALARLEAKREQVRQRQAAEDAQLDKQARDRQYGFEKPRGGRGGRSGGPGRGGRGGFMGDSERKPPPPAQKPGEMASARGGAAAGSASSRGAGSSQAKPDRKVKIESSGEGSAMMQPDAVAPAPRDDDDDDEEDEYGKPKDIDRINISSDEDGEDDPDGMHVDKDPERSRGMMPIRIERREHVDRQIGINTESSAATATGARRSSVPSAVEVSDYDEEDNGDDDGEAGEAEAKGKKVTRERKGKGRARSDPEAMEEDGADEPEGRRARRKSAARGTSRLPIFQTEEEKREWDIRQNDLAAMAAELDQMGLYTPEWVRATSATEEEAERRMLEGMRREARRDANVFLVQLPPVMPNLLGTGTHITVDEAGGHIGPPVKNEPGGPAPTTSAAAPVAEESEQAQTDVSPKQEEEIKVEEGQDPAAAAEAMLRDETGNRSDDDQLKVQAGYVGKLRVHRSGRTTLDWGGTAMNVTAGMNMQFLQTAVLARMRAPEDSKAAREGRWEGSACSMGQVRGKLIVTPDWTEMLR